MANTLIRSLAGPALHGSRPIAALAGLLMAAAAWAGPDTQAPQPPPAPDPAAQAAPAEPPAAAPGPTTEPAPAGAPEPAAASAPDAQAAPAAPESPRGRSGRISGTVTDTTKRALAGLLVMLESRGEPGLLRVTSTDVRGQYHFKDLPPGPYDVHVEADGYRPGAKNQIEVRPPFQNIVDVRMTPAGEPIAGVPAAVEGALRDAGARAAAAAAPADPDPVVVRGRFLDSQGRPVVEASVLLAGAGGARVYQGFSGEDGGLRIEGVVPGQYRVLVRSIGHVPIDLRVVRVLPADGLNLSLVLVDFPLNFRARPQGSPPQEMPRLLPEAAPTPPLDKATESAPAPPGPALPTPAPPSPAQPSPAPPEPPAPPAAGST